MVNHTHEDENMGKEEITNDVRDDDLEIIDEEAREADKIKTLRHKLTETEAEKRTLQDDLQRAKADFLNARKRLDEERSLDKIRHRKQHIEELLPLCDSFEMAMRDEEAWERADKAWRAGIEGIHNQLKQLLGSYGVKIIHPLHEPFDPYRHEAIGTEAVTDKALDHTVTKVVQQGYEIAVGDRVEVIRPARVTIGELAK
ncbi:MAG: nucleotide exchange factor GrpE [Patescibacteria group bacterium]